MGRRLHRQLIRPNLWKRCSVVTVSHEGLRPTSPVVYVQRSSCDSFVPKNPLYPNLPSPHLMRVDRYCRITRAQNRATRRSNLM
jgi:hypothetical protein